MNSTLMQTAVRDSTARLEQFADRDRFASCLVRLSFVGLAGAGPLRLPGIRRNERMAGKQS